MEDALAKAKAIAAKLAGNMGGTAPAAPAPDAGDSALGKRRWDEDINSGESGARPGVGPDKKPSVTDIYGPGSGSSGGGSDFEMIMKIPNNMVGIVIGKGGESISKLMAQSGANMQIEKEHEMMPGETMRKISLRGRQENCEDLKRRVEEVVTTQQLKDSGKLPGVSSGVGANGMKEQNYPFIMKAAVPNDRVGVIIGRQGATIKMIQDRTQTNIQIPQVPDAENPNTRTISIGGYTKESIDAAQVEIFNQLQSYAQNGGQAPRPAAPAGGNIMYIHVPDERVGLIIGKGGATIREIQNRNAIRIQIPPTAEPGTYPPMRSVSLQGSHESQQSSKYEIETLLNLAPGSLMQVPAPGAAGGVGGYAAQGYGASAYGQQAGYAAQYGQQQGAYGAQAAYGQQVAYGAAPAAAAPAVAPAADAYYEDFWKYADYYGEEAARAYYQSWAPPVGTPRPGAPAAAADASTGAADTPAASAGEGAAPASCGDDSAPKDDKNAAGVDGDKNDTDTTDSPDEKCKAEGADEAWEQYKKQYAEWWNAHGKQSGAPEDPAAAYAAQQAGQA